VVAAWLKTQRLVQRSVMAEGKALQIPQPREQPLKIPRTRHQEQKTTGRKRTPRTHPVPLEIACRS